MKCLAGQLLGCLSEFRFHHAAHGFSKLRIHLVCDHVSTPQLLAISITQCCTRRFRKLFKSDQL